MFTINRILTAGLLGLALIVAGCAGSDGVNSEETADEAQTVRSLRVETLELQPAEFEDVIEITGSVEAVNDARLSAQASGTVMSLAELGTFVQRGQTVAQLDPGLARAAVQQAEAAVESAQAQLDLAEDNLRRQEPLYRDSVISALEFENVRSQRNQAQAGLNQAKAALAQVQEQLNNTRVVAPFAGTVEERFVEEGEQVAPSTPVIRIVSTQNVKVVAGVPERYAGDIEVGTPVQVRLQAYGREPLQGTVTFSGSAINPQNRTFPIEVALANASGTLKPEMVAKVLVTRQHLEDVIVIPQAAVLREENSSIVYAVNHTDSMTVADRRQIQLGPSYNGRIVVTGGLEMGEEVVVLGQTNLTHGDALEITEQYTSVGAAGVPLKGEAAPENADTASVAL